MCDIGRFGFAYTDHPDRLTRPQVRKKDSPLATSWEVAIGEAVAGIRAATEAHGAEQVAVLLSPWMTNEELYLARRLFVETLGIENIGLHISPAEPAEGDDFLITADRNPNSQGAKWLGVERGLGSRGILDALAGGKLRALVIFRHDFFAAERGGLLLDASQGLEFLLYAGTREDPTAERAHVVLPLAVWTEREGSCVNIEGRVQRFPRVLQPPGEALADLEVLLLLARASGAAYPYRRAREVFEEIGSEHKKLAKVDWEEAGQLGARWHINGTGEVEPLPAEGEEVPVV
jgi:predicted molibdopterin-dependent oxidoreductase YjgC